MTVATLDEPRRAALAAFFREGVLPVLTPLAIDVVTAVSAAVLAQPESRAPAGADAGETERRLAIVQVPAGLTRLVEVAGGDGDTYVLLEEVIRAQLAQLFPGQAILESAVIRLARDAELELDDEGGRTHLEVVEREVRAAPAQRRGAAGSGVVGVRGAPGAAPRPARHLRRRRCTPFPGRSICGCCSA